MKKMIIMVVFLMCVIILISGCKTEVNKPEYICKDGTVVNDASECKAITTTTAEAPTTTIASTTTTTTTPPTTLKIGLIITENSIRKGSQSNDYISGIVLNNGNDQEDLIKIVATFYDSDKNKVGTASAKPSQSTLDPGQSSPFEISFSKDLNYETFELEAR